MRVRIKPQIISLFTFCDETPYGTNFEYRMAKMKSISENNWYPVFRGSLKICLALNVFKGAFKIPAPFGMRWPHMLAGVAGVSRATSRVAVGDILL